MRNKAEEWAISMGMEIDFYMGSGDFGEAYETVCGKVIKITNDQLEYICADRMIGRKNDYAANIYATSLFDNGNIGILQERLNTDSDYDVEFLWMELTEEIEKEGCDFYSLDTRDFDEGIDDMAIKMHTDICFAIMEIRASGTDPMDISPENIGLNDNGNFGLFDQKQKNLNPEYEFKEYTIDKSILAKKNAILTENPELANSINCTLSLNLMRGDIVY